MPPTGQLARQRYKVVILGAPGVGKTALVRRLADGSFEEGPRPRGLDFYTCQIPLRDDVTVTLQLWDLSDCPCRPGDDESPLSTYIFNSQAVLVVYDVSTPSSLEDMRHALTSVAAAVERGGGGRPYIALVANKCDLQWAASESLARELATRHGCIRYTASARTGLGVQRMAVQVACDLAGVPLAATDYSTRFAADGPGTGPDTESLRGMGMDALGLGASQVESSGAGLGTRLPSRAEPQAARGPQPQDSQRSRAPLYQAMQQGPSVGNSRTTSYDEIGMQGLDGAVRSDQDWRPVSRKTSASPTAMLISKTGPLGQRVTVRSTSPETAAQVGLGAAQASLRQPGPLQQPQQVLPAEGGIRSRGKGWRVWCCCGSGRQ